MNSKSGFTLIELIISVTIIGILLGLSYSGYATFTQRQKLITAGQTLKNILRDVASRSFNGEVDCSVCNCTDPTAEALARWYVDLAARQFYGNCNTYGFTVTNLGLSGEIFILSNNPTIEFYNTPPSVNKDTNICISLNGLDNKYYRIVLSKSGEISDSGGLSSECEI